MTKRILISEDETGYSIDIRFGVLIPGQVVHNLRAIADLIASDSEELVIDDRVFNSSELPICGTFRDRLRFVIGEQSVNSFARQSSVGESLIRSYLRGATPRLDKAILIACAANVSLDWLATGRGDE